MDLRVNGQISFSNTFIRASVVHADINALAHGLRTFGIKNCLGEVISYGLKLVSCRERGL